jgi:cobalt-zinc-cadmium efflux system membrane fusion protein
LKVRSDLTSSLKFKQAKVETVAGELTGYGKLSFAAGASYSVQVPFHGIVESVEVENGAEVKEGDLLARIHSRELSKMRSDYTRLEPTLEAEKNALQRAENLVKHGAVSAREVIETKARVAALEAEMSGIRNGLSAARADLDGDDLYLLKADRAGQILQRNIEPGEQLNSADGLPAFVIGDASNLVVLAQFPERDAPLLAIDQPVHIHLSALHDEQLHGRVAAIVRAIDESSRTTKVKCILDQPDSRLHAEMSAKVIVEVTGDPQLTVPQAAVLLRRESRVVLVKKNDCELERRPVTLGTRVGDRVQVLSGLQEGDEVVVDGAVLLDGELDRIVAGV